MTNTQYLQNRLQSLEADLEKAEEEKAALEDNLYADHINHLKNEIAEVVYGLQDLAEE